MHVKVKRLKKIVFSGLALVVLAVAAFASCQAIADTTGLIQTPETVWIRLVPSVASLGKAKLVLDFSKAIPGLTNDTPTADLRTLFTFANGEGCTEAEKITPVHITKDSEAVYTLTVEQVPNAEKGIVLVTIHQLGIAPPTRAWSLDGEVYEISLSRTDNGGALENTSYSFPEAVTGYGAQTALSVTVANTGSAPTGELNITLSGDAAAQFSLSASTLASIAAGGTGGKIFTVQANDGLDVGDYTALVTVGGGNSIEASFTVQLSVVAPPLWSHNAEELAPLPEYYVTQNGRGDKDGRDWDNAVNKLKLFDVLEKAAVLGAGGVVKVYVAAGTYIPWNTHGDDAPISNAASFPLAGNVAVYGGFANRLSGTVNAADMSAREARFNTDGAGKGYGTILPGSLDYETILSGDLNGDDEYDATGLLSGNDSDNSYHVVTLVEGANAAAIMDGFTIKGGNAASQTFETPEEFFGIYGGGMLLYSIEQATTPILTRLSIIGNKAGNGGGMCNTECTPVLTNVTIAYNHSIGLHGLTDWGGGGMYNAMSSPVLTNVTISNNQASGSGGGGGICNVDASPVLTNVTISDNQASTDGGGIFNNLRTPVLTNVTIMGNQANTGGGMCNGNQASPVLTNVTISGNQASDAGGGMYNSQSSPVLTNVTITGNQASRGGSGMHNFVNCYPPIRNSIIWGNTSDDAVANVYNSGSSPTWSYSIVEGSGGGWTDFGEDGGNNRDAAPAFVLPVPASNAPTSAGNYRLQAGSPAVNVGSDSFYEIGQSPDLRAITTDLDGKPRFNGTVDMGAYER